MRIGPSLSRTYLLNWGPCAKRSHLPNRDGPKHTLLVKPYLALGAKNLGGRFAAQLAAQSGNDRLW